MLSAYWVLVRKIAVELFHVVLEAVPDVNAAKVIDPYGGVGGQGNAGVPGHCRDRVVDFEVTVSFHDSVATGVEGSETKKKQRSRSLLSLISHLGNHFDKLFFLFSPYVRKFVSYIDDSKRGR